MNGMGGLFELVMVFAIVLAFALVELRINRRERKKAGDAKRNDQGST